MQVIFTSRHSIGIRASFAPRQDGIIDDEMMQAAFANTLTHLPNAPTTAAAPAALLP